MKKTSWLTTVGICAGVYVALRVGEHLLSMTLSTVNPGQAILASDINAHISQTNTNTNDISTANGNISTLQSQMNTANSNISNLQSDVSNLKSGNYQFPALKCTGNCTISGTYQQNNRTILDGTSGSDTYIDANGNIRFAPNGSSVGHIDGSGNLFILGTVHTGSA